MSTFSSIFFNGSEYDQMWFNGSMVWEKEREDVVIDYPYTDCDSVITCRAEFGVNVSFKVIDSTKSYSVNGESVTSKYYQAGTYQLKLKNLIPTYQTGFFPLNIEQLRVPKLTELNNLFRYFCYKDGYEYSWQPQYFEFNKKPTSLYGLLSDCKYLTNEMLAQFMPYFPSTSNVTNFYGMFMNCTSLTSLDLDFNTSKVTNMSSMFYGCTSLQSINVTSFDTSSVTSTQSMFYNIKNINIYIGSGWTLGTSSSLGSGSGLVFVFVNPITSISLESTLGSAIANIGEQITITPTVAPTNYSNDEVVVTYDSNYLSKDGDTYTVLNTAFGQELSITYSSKYNLSASATYTFNVRAFVPITSITLTHTLETLTDVPTATIFNVVPTVLPIIHDDELLVDYDTNYISMTDNRFTVLNTAGGQTIQIIYYSKYDNNVNAILEFDVVKPFYPYEDADSVVTYMNTSTSASSKTFAVIDSSLPYSINGVGTNTFSFPANTETQVKLVNLKPVDSTNMTFAKKFEQLRLPKLTDLSKLFYYSGYNSGYDYSWSPQYFEFNPNPTDMSYMFGYCRYNLTDEVMEQFKPHFSSMDTSKVKNMYYTFYNCLQLKNLDLSYFDTSSLVYPYGMFNGCSSLTELDLSNFDTHNVTHSNLYSFMFNSVANCTIYINTDKWTLGTSSSLGGGSNLTFVSIVVPITSVDDLVANVDVANVNTQSFTITPIISPSNFSSDLEVIYDSTYVTTNDNKTYNLVDGCQGKTFDITYRSKSNNSISRTITLTVAEDLVFTEIDFTQSYAPTYPTWFSEANKNSTYPFIHKYINYSRTNFGLVNDNYSGGQTAWTCFKITAPITGKLEIAYRTKPYNTSQPFTIHITTSASQPSYSSSSNRILSQTSTTYAETDGIVTKDVVQGTVYYLHVQKRMYNNQDDKGAIRKITIKPTE